MFCTNGSNFFMGRGHHTIERVYRKYFRAVAAADGIVIAASMWGNTNSLADGYDYFNFT